MGSSEVVVFLFISEYLWLLHFFISVYLWLHFTMEGCPLSKLNPSICESDEELWIQKTQNFCHADQQDLCSSSSQDQLYALVNVKSSLTDLSTSSGCAAPGFDWKNEALDIVIIALVLLLMVKLYLRWRHSEPGLNFATYSRWSSKPSPALRMECL